MATNGGAPTAITPHASTAVGDLMVWYSYNRITTVGSQFITFPTGWLVVRRHRDANGLITMAVKFRKTGETTYTSTAAGLASGNSGDSLLQWIETFSGALGVQWIGSGGTTWASSLNYGPIAAVASASIPVGGIYVVFGGRMENVTAQTLLTGDGLTWSLGVTADTTLGSDASAVTQRGLNGTAAAVSPTSKTITSTGTAQVGKGLSFVVMPLPANTAYDTQLDSLPTPPSVHFKMEEPSSDASAFGFPVFYDRKKGEIAQANNSAPTVNQPGLISTGRCALFNTAAPAVNTLDAAVVTQTTTAMTFEVWFQPTLFDAGGDKRIIERTAGGNTHILSYSDIGGTHLVRFVVATSSGGWSVDSVTNMVVGNLYHIVATTDASVFQIYMNGALDNYGTLPGGTTLSAATDVIKIATFGPFGYVDEIAFYPAFLTSAQVAANYAAGAVLIPRKRLIMPSMQAVMRANGW